MRLSILLSLLFGGISVICNPIKSTVIARGGSGYVTDTTGNQYALYDTGDSNIRAITDKINGEYMRPVSYSISSGHICKFWSEATRGIGYLIGEFTGPVHAAFGPHWAAFFECLDLTIGLPVGFNHGPAGNVLDSNGVIVMLQVEEELATIGMKEDYYHPKNLHIAKEYFCEFYIDCGTGRLDRIGGWRGPTDDTFHDVYEQNARSTALYRCSETSQSTHSSPLPWDISSPEDVAGQI